MSRPTLTPEPQAEAQPIADTLMEAAREEISAIAELLASKPDHQLLGRTEFEVRDRVHKIGAKAIETALNGRKKGGYPGSSRISLLGAIVRQDRADYRCPTCHAGHVPGDTALGLSACKPTPAAEELMTMAGTLDRFADAAEKLLPKMSGLQPSESPVQRGFPRRESPSQSKGR